MSLGEQMSRYTELSGNDGVHTPIGIIGAYLDGYEKGKADAQQWIPVTERLPDDETDILVTYVDVEETRIVPVNYGRGTWFDCIFDRELNPVKITAWMPLPEPWKGGAEECH